MKKYQELYEGQEVIRIKGDPVRIGNKGKVVQDAGGTEKYVLVQWTNNQTWIEKSCVETC